MYHMLLITWIKLSKVRHKYLSKNKLAKSQLDVTKCQEVNEESNQVLNAAQMTLPKLHTLHTFETNKAWSILSSINPI